MREKIIRKARTMFFRYGFKDVTMDEIARAVGISKKTLYQCFPTKEELIEATVEDFYRMVLEHIQALETHDLHAIEEFLSIRSVARKVLDDIETPPSFQLERYYPEISDRMKNRLINLVIRWFSRNIQRGKEEGMYRENIHAEMAARFFFAGMTSIGHPVIFPPDRFPKKDLQEQFVRFFLETLLTEKGKAHLQKIQQQ